MNNDPTKQEQKWEFNIWWHLIFPLGVIFLIGCAFLLWRYHEADKPEPVSGKITNNIWLSEGSNLTESPARSTSNGVYYEADKPDNISVTNLDESIPEGGCDAFEAPVLLKRSNVYYLFLSYKCFTNAVTSTFTQCVGEYYDGSGRIVTYYGPSIVTTNPPEDTEHVALTFSNHPSNLRVKQ